MTDRRRQARALGRELSARAGTGVEIRYARPGEWFAEWESGPSVEHMGDLVDEHFTAGRYPGLRTQKIGYSRHCGPAAWAARAVASRRDGSLAGAVAEGADYRRSLGVIHPCEPGPEHFALTEHVDILILHADWPDRPSDPADAPVIERLLEASGRSETRMAELLLAERPLRPHRRPVPARRHPPCAAETDRASSFRLGARPSTTAIMLVWPQ